MEVSGGYLLVHTCHNKYKSNDGYNHQANMSFCVDIDKMDEAKVITLSYASHSFNQMIRTEGGKVVTADLGDGYPRGIVLREYTDDSAEGYTGSGHISGKAMIMEFSGNIGDNWTGATLGDLQVSDSSYLVAGSTTDQSLSNSETYNVFVGAVDKDSKNVTFRWFTDIPENWKGHTACNPYLVKISEDRFLLVWNEDIEEYGATKEADLKTALKCVYLNGEGEAVSEVYDLKGALSDCEPVVSDGEIVWYAFEDNTITFYHMPASDPSKLTAVRRKWKKPSEVELRDVKKTVKRSDIKKDQIRSGRSSCAINVIGLISDSMARARTESQEKR